MLQIQSTPAIQMSLHWDFDRAESRKFFFRRSMTRSTTNFDSTRSKGFQSRHSIDNFASKKQSELRKSTVHKGYGNRGCGIFKGGVQN